MSNNQKKIYLRVDGSSTIGYGHIFRCIALAQMLMSEFHCIFATRIFDVFLKNTILHAGFDIWELQLENNHFEEFITKLNGSEIVVLDNYFFDTNYQKKIKEKGCKLVCIDDIHDKHFVADIVINHAEGICKTAYSSEKYTKLLLGYTYALLRPSFLKAAQQKKTQKKHKKTILVSLGGTDQEELVIKATNTFLRHPEIQSISLISNIDKSKLTNTNNKPINQYWNLSEEELSKIMQASDIGFLPASTISVEACACKMPFIGGWFVSNQINIYNAIIHKGLAIGIGNMHQLCEKELYDAICEITKPQISAKIISNQEKVIDGQSGIRILNECKQLC